MGKHSGRYTALAENVDKTQQYNRQEAVALVKETGNAGFDETVEVAIKLGVDPNKGEQNVRGSLILPHGTGNVPRVAVFADGEAAQAAKEAGADRVGSEDLIAAIDEGWEDFDILVAHPAMMRFVGKLGRKLGPRMPNKKAGNITDDVGAAVENLKAGKVEFRVDRGAVIRLGIGKVSFTDQQLIENLIALMASILAARPGGLQSRYVISAVMSSSMGPGIKLDVRDLTAGA